LCSALVALNYSDPAPSPLNILLCEEEWGLKNKLRVSHAGCWYSHSPIVTLFAVFPMGRCPAKCSMQFPDQNLTIRLTSLSTSHVPHNAIQTSKKVITLPL
jgi:hypothetical protein